MALPFVPALMAILRGGAARGAGSAAVRSEAAVGRQAAKSATAKSAEAASVKTASTVPAKAPPQPKVTVQNFQPGAPQAPAQAAKPPIQAPQQPVRKSKSPTPAQQQPVGQPKATPQKQQPVIPQRQPSFFQGMRERFQETRQKLGAGTIEPAMERTAESRKSLASKPKVDFGKLMQNMGQPDALANARNEAQEKTTDLQDDLNQKIEDEADERKKLIPQIKEMTKKAVPLIVAFGKMTGGAIAFVVATFAIRKWTDYLEQSRRQLELYNGRIAAAFVKLDIQKFQQGIRTGRETAATTENLSEAIHEFREAFRPIHSTILNIANIAATGFLKVSTSIITLGKVIATFSPLIQAGFIVIDWINDQKDKPDPLPQEELGKALRGAANDPAWKNQERDPLNALPPLKRP